MRERHLVEARVALEPRIVDEDVHRAEVLDGAAEHVRDLRFGGYVGPHRQRTAAGARDLFGHLDCLVLAIAVVDGDVGSRRAEGDGDGLADPGVRPGDECLLACERLVLPHLVFSGSGFDGLVAGRARALHARLGVTDRRRRIHGRWTRTALPPNSKEEP